MKLLYLKNLPMQLNKSLPKDFKAYIKENKLKPTAQELVFYDVCYELCILFNLTETPMPKEINVGDLYNIMWKNKSFRVKPFTRALVKEKKQLLWNVGSLLTKGPDLCKGIRNNKRLYNDLKKKRCLTLREYKYLKELDEIFFIWVQLFCLNCLRKAIKLKKKN
jgi:hypothetical protein